MAFDKLFEPTNIGTVKIKNRYVYAPTNFIFNDWEGLVNEEEIAYNVARAKGGAGLIIYGAILSTKFGVPLMPHPWVFCWDIRYVPGLAMVAEAIRLSGATPFIQLLPVPGNRGHSWTGTQSVAPSEMTYPLEINPVIPEKLQKIFDDRFEGSWIKSHVCRLKSHSGQLGAYGVSRELTQDEIKIIIKENAMSCKLAVLAGFEGIELHQCHHYLVDEFRDPRLNKRKDKYGGSLENRHRFLVELADAAVRAAKEERSDMVVGVRIGSECGGEGGYTFEETKILAQQLQEVGIDYWHATGGTPRLPGGEEDGFSLKYTRELKKILKIPVMTYGFHDPAVAEKAVTEGAVDMVSLATPLIADPEYVNKVKENRVNDIVKCTRCGFCWLGFNLCLPCRCEVNPEVGFEKNNPKYRFTQGFKGVGMFPNVLRRKPK